MPPIEAVYENGVFRPLQPVELPEGARVEVLIINQPDVSSTEPVVGEELADLLDQVAALPYVPPPDGRTDISVRHDDVLYPRSGKIP